MTTQTRNEVLLEGTPLDTPQLSHENHGTRFYRFYLEVPRLSGTPDTLPVLLPEVLLPQIPREGPLQIHGQLRSFNNRSGVGSRLVLTVYALDIQPGTGEACNLFFFAVSVCIPPVFRRTPLGRSICDLMLAVSRRYGRADYLPVITWGQLAVQASRLEVGDPVALEGRVQSRIYHKVTEEGTQERVAYEVSVMHLLDTDAPEPEPAPPQF